MHKGAAFVLLIAREDREEIIAAAKLRLEHRDTLKGNRTVVFT